MRIIALAGALACLVFTHPVSSQPVEAGFLSLLEVEPGLSQPLSVVNAGDGSGRLFFVQQCGTVRILENGELLPTPFLDISDQTTCGGERGLLGLAFHPDHASNGFVFVSYTDNQGDSVISRFQVDSGNPDIVDETSETSVIHVGQPNSNHNGGHVAFGPDGYLYIALGDGGGGGDPDENAQDTSNLLGNLLRLDVDGDDFPGDSTRNYAIPGDNPFVGMAGLDEIWAYGLRNPWRFSFDRLTGDLFIGDVGETGWEEIDRQPAASSGAENYGWDVLEGAHCHEDVPAGSCSDFLAGDSVLPVREYSHSGGNCSITGGFVYRGSERAAIAGRYFYGDFCTGRLWHMAPDGSDNQLFGDTPFNIAGFGEDEAGHLYLADLSGGVHRLTPYTFSDVPPDAFAWEFIETVADRPITAGCQGGVDPQYCPSSSVSREQMAVFILRAIEAPGYTPPACGGNFNDVPCPSAFADWIEELAARGITAGCGGGNYCPQAAVTREQMAVFLLKGVEGSGYAPPACSGMFADVPCPSLFADWVEELAGRGITAGCGGGNYCPDQAVTRAQMAVFLVNAFGFAIQTP